MATKGRDRAGKMVRAELGELVYSMGIDPGGTSGWAIIGVPRPSMFMINVPASQRVISYFDCGQVTGDYTSQAYALADIASGFKSERIAVALESFFPKKPLLDEYYLSPLAVIYRLQMLFDTGWLTCPLFMQSPDQAMNTAPDHRLKQWGLYRSGPDHIKDGTRHAITFIRRARTDRALREAAWHRQIRGSARAGSTR